MLRTRVSILSSSSLVTETVFFMLFPRASEKQRLNGVAVRSTQYMGLQLPFSRWRAFESSVTTNNSCSTPATGVATTALDTQLLLGLVVKKGILRGAKELKMIEVEV